MVWSQYSICIDCLLIELDCPVPVLRERFEVPRDCDVGSEPGLLHSQARPGLLEDGVEAGQAGLGEQEVGIAVSVERPVLLALLEGVEVGAGGQGVSTGLQLYLYSSYLAGLSGLEDSLSSW